MTCITGTTTNAKKSGDKSKPASVRVGVSVVVSFTKSNACYEELLKTLLTNIGFKCEVGQFAHFYFVAVCPCFTSPTTKL